MFLRLILLVLSAGLLTSEAIASLTFCNQTPQMIESAVAYRYHNQWVSEGWWRLNPKQCLRVIGMPLEQRFYYYHARNPATGKVYGGKYYFCTTRQPFLIAGDNRACSGKNAVSTGFGAADVGERRQFSFDFRD